MDAALLHLPCSPPVLIASVYASYKASYGETDKFCRVIQKKLQPLLQSYSRHVSGGNFNTIITPSLDGHNMHSGRAWHRLANKVAATPPALVDSFRRCGPDAHVYTRYPQAHHASESRMDMVFCSPPVAEHVIPQSANILTDDLSTKHHPVSCMATAPPPSLPIPP